MKKYVWGFILSTCLLFAAVFSGCGSDASRGVYFDVNGDTYYFTEVDADGRFTLPDEPTLSDSTFLGWYYFNAKGQRVRLNDGRIGDANFPLVVYAEFKALKSNSITYKLNGGINDESNPDKCYDVNSGDNAITLGAPTRKTLISTKYSSSEDGTVRTEVFSEYDFEGWFTDESFSNEIKKLDYSLGDVTLHAKWSSAPVKRTCVQIADYFIDGNLLYTGAYPQSLVTDGNKISKLDGLSGAVPTAANFSKWSSYEFYVNGNKSDYAFYIDVVLDGVKYRGVYFTEYRPSNATYAFSSATTQRANGYAKNTVYWFEYQPISWTVLNSTQDEILVFSEKIIDTVCFNTDDYTEEGVYLNNYEHSYIRKFLNSEFLSTAFTNSQQNTIKTTLVDNSLKTSFSTPNPYVCADTKDKIFLLSYRDLVNSDYGFNKGYSYFDSARQKSGTDYSNALGLRHGNDDYSQNATYWLRTPFFDSKNVPHVVRETGYSTAIFSATESCVGLVPAMNVKIK